MWRQGLHHQQDACGIPSRHQDARHHPMPAPWVVRSDRAAWTHGLRRRGDSSWQGGVIIKARVLMERASRCSTRGGVQGGERSVGMTCEIVKDLRQGYGRDLARARRVNHGEAGRSRAAQSSGERDPAHHEHIKFGGAGSSTSNRSSNPIRRQDSAQEQGHRP